MCGIIYVKRNDNLPVMKSVIKRFNNQKSRGTQGFGYITIANGKLENLERATKETEIMEKLRTETASEILFHHRLPTSTPNTEDTTHPIVVSNKLLEYNYYVLHNGVIRNEDERKKVHDDLGFEYSTYYEEVKTIYVGKKRRKVQQQITHSAFNDSEALAIDLALYIEGIIPTVETTGSIAFVMVRTDKKANVDAIYWGHNYGNPMTLEGKPGEQFFELKSVGGKDVDINRMFKLDYSSQEITSWGCTFSGYSYASQSSNRSSIGFNRSDDDHDASVTRALTAPRTEGLALDFSDYDKKNPKLPIIVPVTEESRESDFYDIDQQMETAMNDYYIRRFDENLSKVEEELIQIDADIEFCEEMIASSSASEHEKSESNAMLVALIDEKKKKTRERDDMQNEYDQMATAAYGNGIINM